MRLKEEIHGVRSGRRRRKASRHVHSHIGLPSIFSLSLHLFHLSTPPNTLTRSLNHLSLSSATFEFLWKDKCDMKLAKRLHTLLSLSYNINSSCRSWLQTTCSLFLLYAPVSCWCKGQSERTLYWHETKQGWEYMFVYGVCVHKHVAASRHPYKLPTPCGGSSSFRNTYSNTEKQAVMVSKIEKVFF